MRGRSAALSVMDAGASRGKHVDDYAALASSAHGPRTNQIANMMHYKEGKSGSHYFTKVVGSHPRGGLVHAHDHMRKYNRNVKSGIAAHTAVYGGQE